MQYVSNGRVYSFAVITQGELVRGWFCSFSSTLWAFPRWSLLTNKGLSSEGFGYGPASAGHLLEIFLMCCPWSLGKGWFFFYPKWVLGKVPMFCKTSIALGPVNASYKNQDLWLRPASVIMLSFLMLHVPFWSRNAMQGNLLCCDNMCIPWGLSFSLFWELAM